MVVHELVKRIDEIHDPLWIMEDLTAWAHDAVDDYAMERGELAGNAIDNALGPAVDYDGEENERALLSQHRSWTLHRSD